jgi:phosphatidylglycerophosphate synthase
MVSNSLSDPKSVVEPNYFSNWGDLWYPKLANRILLRPASRIKWLTPNMVTVASFFLYSLSGILAVAGGSYSYAAVGLLPLSYILDCLDGQLARYTGRTSPIGDYLDKTLDVIKIFIINLSMSLMAVNMTHKSYYFVLGMLSCFGFLFRYYIKLETMFGAVNKDKDYLDKSRAYRHELYAKFDAQKAVRKNTIEKIRWFAMRNRAVLALDEAEHVTFAAIAILFNAPAVWCWVFGIMQLTLALYRLFQRGGQIMNNPESLQYPLRK